MDGGKMKKMILLVEDEALIAMNEAAVLDEHGYDVMTAATGEEALEYAAEGGIDLILMDIDLGPDGMDGTETARRILESIDVPVVFLSSHTEPEVVEKTEKITSYGYIVKDSGDTVLLASIKMAFRLFEANKRLKLNETEIREIVDNIDSAIIRYNSEGMITYFSKGAERIFGYTADEMVGHSGLGLINPEVDSLGISHEDLLKTIFTWPQGFAVHENENIRKDGKRLWMLWKNKLVRDQSGRSLYIQSITDDITIRRQKDRLLRLQAQLLEAIQQAVIATDMDGKIIYINKFAEQLYGWSREEALGLNIMNVTVPQTTQQQAKEIMNALGRGGSWAGDFIVQHKSGREFTAHVTNSPFLDDEGRLAGIIGVSYDAGAEE